MLDVSFYSHEQEMVETIEVTQDFYTWLAHSDFSKIGKSEEKEMKGDGETVKVPVVLLEGEHRRRFSDFLRDAIVEESDGMLNKLGSFPSKEEYLNASSKLKFMQELRKCIEDEKFKYIGRT
jgi:hypothetical protein